MRLPTVVGLVPVFATPAAAQNLLRNGGFETGSLAGWAVGGPSGGSVFASGAGVSIAGTDEIFEPSATLVRSGAHSASGVFRLPRGGPPFLPPEGFTLSQTLSLVAGRAYVVGFSFGNAGSRPWGFFLGAGDPDATTVVVNGLPVVPAQFAPYVFPGEWRDVTASFVAGPAPSVVTFQFVGSGTAFAPVSVDDFYVRSVAPEPGVLWLTAAGLATLPFARRGAVAAEPALRSRRRSARSARRPRARC